MNFSLSSSPLEQLTLSCDSQNSHHGAFITFSGIVRDFNEGRPVVSLEYEAYDDLCQIEMTKIFKEAERKFPIIQMRVVHRVGILSVGEMAVWIGVTAAHRGAAFDACRYLIDELKCRLPIWKKEHYKDGDSGWIGLPSEDSSQSSSLLSDSSDLERDVTSLTDEQLSEATLVDVREPYERMLAPLAGIDCLQIPFGKFHFQDKGLDPEGAYFVFCSKGIRSLQAVHLLRDSGYHRAYSLKNNFNEIRAALLPQE